MSDRESTPEMILRHKTRRAFLVGGLSALGAGGAFTWLTTRSLDEKIPWPLRRSLQVNDRISQALYASSKLARTFPRAQATEPRENGDIGMEPKLDAKDWTIDVRHENPKRQVFQNLKKIKDLPRYEMTTEFKCVEGWSNIVSWAGYRFVDWLRYFEVGTRSGKIIDPRRPEDLYPYVYITTPDEEYYVSLDIASMMHPQTLLCDTMNDEPLTAAHGAPLRLVTTLKYGIKNIKRIGKIEFRLKQPPDYWAERGYDWYAGH